MEKWCRGYASADEPMCLTFEYVRMHADATFKSMGFKEGVVLGVGLQNLEGLGRGKLA